MSKGVFLPRRCLRDVFAPGLVLAKSYYRRRVVLDTRVNLPIHRGDLSGKSAAHEQLPLTLDKGVNAAGLLECRDPAAHPGCAAGEFVVGREDGPVERRLERHEAVHGANGLIAQEGVWQGCGNGFVAVCPVCAVGFVGAVGEAVGGPGRGDLGCVCRVQVLGVLDARFVLDVTMADVSRDGRGPTSSLVMGLPRAWKAWTWTFRAGFSLSLDIVRLSTPNGVLHE